jgi:hypothetical protein
VDCGVNYLKIGVNRFLMVSSFTSREKFNGSKKQRPATLNIGEKSQTNESKNKYGNNKGKKRLVNKDFSGMVHS